MADNHDELAALLRSIVSAGDCDVETARRLESTVLQHFPDADDDDRLEDLMHVLACYDPDPEREEYLCGPNELIRECAFVLSLLQTKGDSQVET